MKTPAVAARNKAAKHLREVFGHFAQVGIQHLEDPPPPEIELPARPLPALGGHEAARLVIERQQWLPFGER